MTVICLMLFLTIVLLGSAISLTYSMNATIKENIPKDLQVIRQVPEGETIPESTLTETLTADGLDMSSLKDIEDMNVYS